MSETTHAGGPPNGPGTVNLVVARFQNGSMVKGSTQDFYPERPIFHVVPRGATQAVNIRMSELKAVFFVRDLLGNRLRNKQRDFPTADPSPAPGRRIAVQFKDGELLVGYALNYTLEKPGFFVFPVDPHGNNLRAYVIRAATQQVRLGPAAEQLVQTAPRPQSTFKPPAAA